MTQVGVALDGALTYEEACELTQPMKKVDREKPLISNKPGGPLNIQDLPLTEALGVKVMHTTTGAFV